VTNLYIGKLFECGVPCVTGGLWTGTKHLFADDTRIATKPITTTPGEICAGQNGCRDVSTT
jgi:hypothetical protein